MNNILFVGEHMRTYSVQWHAHEEWELVYCTGGKGEFVFENGTTLTYEEGEAIAVPPHERHANNSSEGFTNIHIRVTDHTLPYKSAFRVSDDSENHLLSAFREAKYYFLSDIQRRELVLTALGYLISSYMVVYRSNNDFSEPVDQIRSQILKHYSDPAFELEKHIRSLPFHYDYLRKLFKKEMSVTPLEYMTNLRMKKAETLLTIMWSNEYSMSEVADMCGFDDPLYFSRVFKKHYGCSPSNFSKLKRQQNSGDKEGADS